MYVIMETGGKQYRVSEGQVVKVEKLDAAEGSKVTFDNVLVYSNDGKLELGNPYISGAKVEATVLENGKNAKVIVYKYKSKKASQCKNGHRQPFTAV
ncbi:MAG: 50S ribosomal protein L21, partial [Clostridia bacterium]|nr:50S ribosomal protein L21 [Clostridia bacterium]